MKKVLKAIMAVFMVAALVAVFAVGLAACNDDKDVAPDTLQLYVPDGAPALAVAKFIAEKDTLTVAGYKIAVNIVPANQIAAHMAKADGDIVIMPANAGMNLISKGAGYEFVCSNTRGILYMLSLEQVTVTPADLAGKKVGCIGEGAVPEYALMTVLEANGVADDVDVRFFADGAAVQAALKAGTIDFGIVGEPAATAGASKGFFTVMDMQAEFNEATDSESGFPMSSTFVSEALAGEDGFVEALVAALEDETEVVPSKLTVGLSTASDASEKPITSRPFALVAEALMFVSPANETTR